MSRQNASIVATMVTACAGSFSMWARAAQSEATKEADVVAGVFVVAAWAKQQLGLWERDGWRASVLLLSHPGLFGSSFASILQTHGAQARARLWNCLGKEFKPTVFRHGGHRRLWESVPLLTVSLSRARTIWMCFFF